MQLISIVGWNSLLLIFGAKSAAQLLLALGALPHGFGARQLVPAATLIACAVIYLTLLRGATGVTKVSNVLAAHVPIGFWMLWLLVSRRWPELRQAEPAMASPDRVWNYTTGVEIGITATMSWWPYIGAMIRMAPNARTAVVPVMLGMGASIPLLSLIGLAGILVLKSSDPSEWLRSVGGPTYAIVSLIFVSMANFGTAITGIYSSAIGLRHFAMLERVSWSTLLMITIAPVALVGALIPELFFAHFGAFLAFLGVAFAPPVRHTDRRLLHVAPATCRNPRVYSRGAVRALSQRRRLQSGGAAGTRAGLCSVSLAAQSADLCFEWTIPLPDGVASRRQLGRTVLHRADRIIRPSADAGLLPHRAPE